MQIQSGVWNRKTYLCETEGDTSFKRNVFVHGKLCSGSFRTLALRLFSAAQVPGLSWVSGKDCAEQLLAEPTASLNKKPSSEVAGTRGQLLPQITSRSSPS